MPGAGAGGRAPTRLTTVFHELARRYVRDRVPGLAAEVAFFAALSLFPAFLVLIAALGSLEALVGAEAARGVEALVVGWLERILTARGQGVVDTVRDLFVQERGGVVASAGLVALWTVSSAFTAVIGALDRAYGVSEDRSWFRVRILGLGLALGTTLMLAIVLTMIVVGPMFGHGRRLQEELGLNGIWPPLWASLRWLAAFVLLVAWTTTLFRAGPCRRTRWRDELPGALLTSLLWLGISLGLRLYVDLASGANEVLGALGGGLILLVWFYLLSLALILGAELNDVLAKTARPASGRVGRIKEAAPWRRT